MLGSDGGHTMSKDARFPDWEPDENTVKNTILYHMSYAHEAQAKAKGIEWWGFNIGYWKRNYSRQELIDIHRKYHEEAER